MLKLLITNNNSESKIINKVFNQLLCNQVDVTDLLTHNVMLRFFNHIFYGFATKNLMIRKQFLMAGEVKMVGIGVFF